MVSPSISKILWIVAHPDLRLSKVNRPILDAVRAAASDSQQQQQHRLVVRDLYALYPDYLVDVSAEREQLAAADLIVWQHPIYWYSMPALMKLWIDEVLGIGWAYGEHGTALNGKQLWLVLSTGGSIDAYQPTGYNEHPLDAFLLPYRQTARLCGMEMLPVSVFHGAQSAEPSHLQAHVADLLTQLRTYPASVSARSIAPALRRQCPPADRPAERSD